MRAKERFPLVLFLLAVDFVFIAPSIAAQYRFDSWTTDNGLPQNSVNAILQTRDGYLWFTTSDGLVRFDGVQFTIFNTGNSKGLTSNRFTGLFEDRRGVLWIGTDGEGLVRYERGAFRVYTKKDGLPDDWVRSIQEDLNGDLLITCPAKLVRMRGEKFSLEIEGEGIRDRIFFYRDRAGAIWWNSWEGLVRFKDGVRTLYTTRDGLTSNDVRAISEDRNGNLWVGARDGALHRLTGGAITAFSDKRVMKDYVRSIFEDRGGNLWLSTNGSGLVKFKDGKFTGYTTAQGLSSNLLRTVYQDREATLWIGTINNGLNRMKKEMIHVLAEKDGLSSQNIYSIYEDGDGAIWIGTWGSGAGQGGVTMYKDGKFSRYTEEDGLRNNLVASLCEDREKRLWVSANGGGLSMLEKGKVRDVTDEFGLAQYEIRAIYRDRRGVMWLATHRGLLGYRNNLVASYTRKEGLVSDDLRAITEGRDGALWIGSYGGLSRLKDGKIISFTTRDGLGSERVRALYEDSEGVLWIGTYDGGISRLKDGKITAFRASDGLFNNGAFQILEDDRGFLWMTCNKGIYRVSRRQLTDFAEGRSKTITSVAYGKADGLIISECNGGYQPAGIKARDGRLWLPTQGGVAVIDPKEISVNFEPPAVVIESCLIDRKYVDLQNPVRIIPGQQNLEIQYTGLSFIKSEHMRFRYKLEGLDNEWVEAGSRRAAYYSHLPPGNYNFVAIAANSDGVWNETGAGLRIIVIPPLYRTWWFISLTTLSLAAISYFAYKRRIHQLEQAKMMQEKLSRWLIDSQENERKRIAAELHDSLGQGLAIIRNRALSGLHSLDYDLAKEQLSEISAQASQMIEEATEIAYNLRPHFLDRLGLTRSILAMVDRIAKTSGVEWTADLDDLDDLFDKDKEIHLYRIVQEAINNVLKHSGASRAAVAIYRSGNDVIITIEDNGKGMPAGSNAFGQPPQFGFGLIGIAERARIFRAKPSIKSGPGKGTSVTIKLKPEGGAQ